MLAIEVRNLHRSYRSKRVVNGVDLTVGAGEIVGLIGRNGAGKSTVVETIAGLRRPDAGTVRVQGLDPIANRADVRSLLGVQLQTPAMHGSLTVSELFRLHASFHRHTEDPGELLRAVALDDSVDVRFENLSGGQQQRLSVALALIGRPRVVLLDELSTGLDPEGRRLLWRKVETLRGEGVSILLVSHSMEEVERLCDRVVLLDAGTVVAACTVGELISRAGPTRSPATLDDAFLSLIGRAS